MYVSVGERRFHGKPWRCHRPLHGANSSVSIPTPSAASTVIGIAALLSSRLGFRRINLHRRRLRSHGFFRASLDVLAGFTSTADGEARRLHVNSRGGYYDLARDASVDGRHILNMAISFQASCSPSPHPTMHVAEKKIIKCAHQRMMRRSSRSPASSLLEALVVIVAPAVASGSDRVLFGWCGFNALRRTSRSSIIVAHPGKG
nr:unnamed protein product [Digitaria exilis]